MRLHLNRNSRGWENDEIFNFKAPHKPILVLSVIHNWEASENSFHRPLDQNLLDSFDQFSKLLGLEKRLSKAQIYLPFLSLKNDLDELGNPFWTPIPFDTSSTQKKPRTLTQLMKVYFGVELSLRFRTVMHSINDRNNLINSVIEEYFDTSVWDILKKRLGIEVGILNPTNSFPEKGFVFSDIEKSELIAAKEKQMKEVTAREGQPAFRESILAAYKEVCCVTGCDVKAVLEAAHIVPYHGKSSNHVQNGLLLRSDIHKLYDTGMLVINPENLFIGISPELFDTEYVHFASKPITTPSSLGGSKDTDPNLYALGWHRKNYSQWWYELDHAPGHPFLFGKYDSD